MRQLRRPHRKRQRPRALPNLIGVALLALLANAGPKVGKIVIILMVGFAIGWAMLNSGWMQKVLGKPTGIDPIYKRFTG
jgi:hypothetical protein